MGGVEGTYAIIFHLLPLTLCYEVAELDLFPWCGMGLACWRPGTRPVAQRGVGSSQRRERHQCAVKIRLDANPRFGAIAGRGLQYEVVRDSAGGIQHARSGVSARVWEMSLAAKNREMPCCHERPTDGNRRADRFGGLKTQAMDGSFAITFVHTVVAQRRGSARRPSDQDVCGTQDVPCVFGRPTARMAVRM